MKMKKDFKNKLLAKCDQLLSFPFFSAFKSFQNSLE